MRKCGLEKDQTHSWIARTKQKRSLQSLRDATGLQQCGMYIRVCLLVSFSWRVGGLKFGRRRHRHDLYREQAGAAKSLPWPEE